MESHSIILTSWKIGTKSVSQNGTENISESYLTDIGELPPPTTVSMYNIVAMI